MHTNASYGKSILRCAMLRSENRSRRLHEWQRTLLLLQAGGDTSASTNTISNSSRCEQAKFDQTLERLCSCRTFNCDWYETGGTCRSVKGTCRAMLSCLQWPAAARGEIPPNPIRLRLSLYIRRLGSRREMRGWTKERLLLLLPGVKTLLSYSCKSRRWSFQHSLVRFPERRHVDVKLTQGNRTEGKQTLSILQLRGSSTVSA